MPDILRLLCVFAHPDDESLGIGGTLIKYANEGVETHLVTATRGERGWFGPAEENPGMAALGKTREAELRCAASILGLRQVNLLDYIDGDLDQADPAQAIAKIARHVRRIRPQVVLTFPPDGIYGHPDHIAISQFTSAALVAAADPSYREVDGPAHRVAKLYYPVAIDADIRAYESVFGKLEMTIEGVTRGVAGWCEWNVTTQIESARYWKQTWDAIQCHRSQLPSYGKLAQLTEAQHRALWGMQRFYRVYSFVNGGRKMETDLFEGLR